MMSLDSRLRTEVMCTHTHTHAHAHTHTCTRSHTPADTLLHACRHTHSHNLQTHAYTRLQTHTLLHACTSMQTHIHTPADTHTHAVTLLQIRTRTQRSVHACPKRANCSLFVSFRTSRGKAIQSIYYIKADLEGGIVI